MPRNKRMRVKGQFYVFLALVCAAAGAAWFFLIGRDSAEVTSGSVDFEAVLPVVVVRDEEVIAAESYGKADYLVPDQQRVEADTAVVDVYRYGYNDKVMNDLVDVRTKIQQYEANNLSGTESELASLNDSISDTTSKIRTAAQDSAVQDDSDAADVSELEAQLTDLMDQRAQYLRDRAAADQQLEEYRQQEQQLEERVASWRDVWKAPKAGVVSYYYDGYEPVINAENIRSASVQQVRRILDGTLPVAQVADGTEPLYRLVNNFQWYIVIPSKEPVLEFANDNTFSAVFSSCPDRQFEGTIIGHIAEGSDHLYVMEFSEDIGALVNTRRSEVTLRASFSGFSVPEDAIVSQNGQTGVNVVRSDTKVFVPVTVRAEDDGRLIVVPDQAGSPLSEGADVET